MTEQERVKKVRKLGQQYAYTSIRMHETVGRQAGLSGTDHKYLGFLLEKGQMTAGELAQLTGLTTGAVTGLIDRFENKKLVKRQFAEEDRRKVLIVPEAKHIRALLEPFYRDFRSKTEELLTSFNSKELKAIESYFLKAIDLMETTTQDLERK